MNAKHVVLSSCLGAVLLVASLNTACYPSVSFEVATPRPTSSALDSSGTFLPSATLTAHPPVVIEIGTNMPPVVIDIATGVHVEGTRTASANRVNTRIASNLATVAAFSGPPLSTPLPSAPANETGIIPGQTRGEQVIALAGEPSARFEFHEPITWSFQSSRLAYLREVRLARGIVIEVEVGFPEAINLEDVLTRYGPPELVAYFDVSDSKEPPPPPTGGYLLYPARGMTVLFACAWDEPCPGLARNANPIYKEYFVPTTLSGLIKQIGQYHMVRVQPWAGFEK